MGFWQDLIGQTSADTSNQAAADTYAKQQQATAGMRGAGQQFATNISGLAPAYDPYINAGKDALTRLMGGLGLGGEGGAADFTAAYHALPGYQSGLDTGTQAALRGINASGMSQSGGALKALQRYGSDYENQRSGDYLNRLAGLQGQGLQATGARTGLLGQGQLGLLGANISSYGGDLNSAGTIGQGMVAGAQAKQKGLESLLNIGANLGGKAIAAFA